VDGRNRCDSVFYYWRPPLALRRYRPGICVPRFAASGCCTAATLVLPVWWPAQQVVALPLLYRLTLLPPVPDLRFNAALITMTAVLFLVHFQTMPRAAYAPHMLIRCAWLSPPGARSRRFNATRGSTCGGLTALRVLTQRAAAAGIPVRLVYLQP